MEQKIVGTTLLRFCSQWNAKTTYFEDNAEGLAAATLQLITEASKELPAGETYFHSIHRVGVNKEEELLRSDKQWVRNPLNPSKDPLNPSKEEDNAPTERVIWSGTSGSAGNRNYFH